MIRTPSRLTVDLQDRWTFVKGKADRRWLAGLEGDGETVDLPHCWNRHDTYQRGRHSFSGQGAYRRTFILPEVAEPGDWLLRSEGFYGPVEIRLDGRRFAVADAQYLGLDIELPSLTPGEHILALRLDNRAHRNVLPGFSAPDFLLYGGLVGRMWLERRPLPAIDLKELEIRPQVDDSGEGSVTIRHGMTAGEIRVEIFDDSNAMVARSTPGRERSPATRLCIENPGLWSPDDPTLYRAEVTLAEGDRVSDRAHLHFGFAAGEFRPEQGFFLNGVRTELHGANRHESIPGLGSALPPELQRRDAEILKELGGNFVRLSHYPQHPAFLDACDELGLLVYPEIATWKSVRSNRGWLQAARRQMRDLILRDRHRPSIILWGMGNESRSKKAYFELGKIIRDLDPRRSSIYAENHLYRARRKRIIGMPDVWGANYELDVLSEAADASRTGNVVVSECCNHPNSVKGDEREELTQLNTLHGDWEKMADLPFVAGYAVWCLTDYATEHRDRFRRQPGLLDAWRRPKMAAELFRARHSRVPFISLFVTGNGPERPPSHFRREVEIEPGGTHEVHVFSNCDGVNLEIDGGTPHQLEGAVHWVLSVGAMPQTLVAEGLCGSTGVRSHWQRHGSAHRIELRPRGEAGPGRTLEIDIDIVDADGTIARNFNGHCRLEIEGTARLHAYTEANEALISRGEGRVYVTCAGIDQGEIRLTASAEGLEGGSAQISWEEIST